MTQQEDIILRVSKTVSDYAGRQPIYERGSERLITALPIMNRVRKKLCIIHATFIYYADYNVKYKIIKHDREKAPIPIEVPNMFYYKAY